MLKLITIILVAALLLSLGCTSPSTDTSTGTGASGGTTTTGTSADDDTGGEPATIGFTCEEILTQSFLEAEYGGPNTIPEEYREFNIINDEGEPFLDCRFETGEGVEQVGGSAGVGLGGIAEYEANLVGMETGGTVTETNNIGLRSFEVLSVSETQYYTMQRVIIYVLTSNDYIVQVWGNTFSLDEDPTPSARIIAQEVVSNLE